MDLWLWIARSVAATVLGIIIFVSFLSFLLVNHFTGKLLDSSFYTQVLNEQDAYSRIYDEVLLDDQVRASTRQLTDDLQIMTHEELVELARDIAPPEYLHDQVEENIQQLTGYMRGEDDVLELYLELGPPLARVKPIIFAELDQRIDELETVEPDSNRSLQEQVAQARALTEVSIRSLGSGTIPASVPSVRFIPEPFRADLFDVALPNLLNEPRLDPRVRNSLEASSAELRTEFISGDTHRFLKVAVRAVVSPILDDTLARLRQRLDSQDRLDILEMVARSNNESAAAELRADIERFRDQVSRVRLWGKTVALVAGVSATVAMLLIYLPSLTNALRWPGLTLLLTGGVLYVLAKILENTLPERLNGLIDSSIASASEPSPLAAELITDISRSLVQQSVEGIATPALVLLVLGVVLFASSFLLLLLKHYVPGLR
jgi:hypothetical protein